MCGCDCTVCVSVTVYSMCVSVWVLLYRICECVGVTVQNRDCVGVSVQCTVCVSVTVPYVRECVCVWV